jgi:nucleoside-diphosphate-sugar epimerase
MPDSVLVIGGSGRTGRLVVRRLLQQQLSVRVMSRRAAVEDPRVDAVHGSITDADAVRAAMRGCVHDCAAVVAA